MEAIDVLMSSLAQGTVLHTPSIRKPFVIQSISPSGVTLVLGKGGWRTPIPVECLNGIPAFLRGKGWVKVGAIHAESEPGTLEHYVDGFIPRSAGNYIAAMLERVGIIEVDRRRPCKVRLLRMDL